ncbi:MAG TPA: inositol monophosphatase family protein, partial [Geminicoccaceae bacterium]
MDWAKVAHDSRGSTTAGQSAKADFVWLLPRIHSPDQAGAHATAKGPSPGLLCRCRAQVQKRPRQDPSAREARRAGQCGALGPLDDRLMRSTGLDAQPNRRLSMIDNLMDFATRTAREAGEITLQHFGHAAVTFKGDGSEVTAADLAAEAYIREALAEAFPDDGIVGEEGEDTPSRSGRRWIVDPIDGTRSFSSGVPLYCVLLALEVDGTPTLGCAHFPALGETLVAATGAGAWHNGERARVSECDDLAQARMITSGLEYWRDRSTDDDRAGFDRLVKATRFTRTWGDGYGYFLVATG